MFALIDKDKKLIGVSTSAEDLELMRAQLKIDGAVVPATFDQKNKDPAKVLLNVHWKLEKFDGDEQTPDKLLETLEGEG